MAEPKGTKMSPRRSPRSGDKNYATVAFDDALKAVSEGGKITRLEWNDPNNYVYMKNDLVCIVFPDDPMTHSWILGKDDIDAGDWVIL